MYRRLILFVAIIFFIFLATVFGAPSINEKQPLNRIKYDDESRIINGTPAYPGQFKYICNLQHHDPKAGYRKFCGSTLIHKKWALTAAHCIIQYVKGNLTADVDKLRVLCGTTNALQYLFEPEKYDTIQLLRVARVYMHQQFGNIGTGSDIALLELQEPAKINQHVQTIELAPLNFDPYHQWALIMGWGQTEPSVSTWELQVAWSLVLKPEECRRDRGWTSFRDDQLCIYREHSGVCFGDSGGPLVHKSESGRDIQLGINSYVSYKGCAAEGAVLTWVSHFLPWIRDTMAGNYDKYNITTEG